MLPELRANPPCLACVCASLSYQNKASHTHFFIRCDESDRHLIRGLYHPSCALLNHSAHARLGSMFNDGEEEEEEGEEEEESLHPLQPTQG